MSPAVFPGVGLPCSRFRLWWLALHLQLRRCAVGMMCFIYWRRRSGLLQRSGDQIVTRPGTVDKSKYVIVGVTLADHLNSAFTLDPRQFRHQERLLPGAHEAIVNVEGQAG